MINNYLFILFLWGEGGGLVGWGGGMPNLFIYSH